jgi:RNA polymerase sigma-70 factor (ECF subfamily)
MDADASLVARARDGDDVAFGQLFHRHHSSVHRAARLLLGATDADDVAQEAWLHAYVHLDAFQETASFKTWVHAIVRNRAIDHHRRTRRRRCYEGTHAAAVPVHAAMRADARTPEALVLEAERDERLAGAIAMLPDRLRVTLELWRTGHSYEEMARMAGVTTGTIKSRVCHARRQAAAVTARVHRKAFGSPLFTRRSCRCCPSAPP